MSRIAPIPRDDLADYEEGFAAIEAFMGFVPSSLFTMARVPRLLEGFTGLAQVVFTNGLLPADLTQMIGHLAPARRSGVATARPTPRPTPRTSGSTRRSWPSCGRSRPAIASTRPSGPRCGWRSTPGSTRTR